jgi:hypothetical protein
MTRASPSRIMTAVDTLLPLGVLLSCLEAYAPEHMANALNTSEMESEDDQPFDFASLQLLKGDYDSGHVSDEEVSVVSEDNDVETDVGNDFVHITYDDIPPHEDILFELPNDLSFKWLKKSCLRFRKLKNKIIGLNFVLNTYRLKNVL